MVLSERQTIRFWACVEMTRTCWDWAATFDRYGYPRFAASGQSVLAHRLAYELTRGPIPDGMTLDHLCRRKICVNPAHLEPVTLAENIRRAAAATTTHCPAGHPYDESNTYVHRGKRYCRICKREAMRRYRNTAKAGKDER